MQLKNKFEIEQNHPQCMKKQNRVGWNLLLRSITLHQATQACQKRLILSRFPSKLSKLDSFMCRLITVWMPPSG